MLINGFLQDFEFILNGLLMRKKSKKIEKIENNWDGPGCFGGCRGVIPEYVYGIFEEF